MSALLSLGRTLLGLCFALDGGWWLYTWDVRAAYLQRSGAPEILVVPIALVYLSCGALVAFGRAVRPATLPLMAVAGLIATVLHTDLGPGGIGEYPLDWHAQINTSALLVQLALVGALMLAFGAPSLQRPIDLRATVLGRVLIGGYFVVDALWQAYYADAAFGHAPPGVDPGLLPVVIGTEIVFGMMLAAGRAVRGVVLPLAVVLAASTVWSHGALGGNAPFPVPARVHQWFVRGAILSGLLMLGALGPIAGPGKRALVLRKPEERERRA